MTDYVQGGETINLRPVAKVSPAREVTGIGIAKFGGLAPATDDVTVAFFTGPLESRMKFPEKSSEYNFC